MQEFTSERNQHTQDEMWFLEHEPVFTYGISSEENEMPLDNSIPIIKTDRGGKVTYHGPGQLVIYALMDLKKRSLKPRIFIKAFYQVIFESVLKYQANLKLIDADPGIYCDNKKLVSFGLKINRRGTYHGASINVSMNMDPWNQIIICGDNETQAIDLKRLGSHVSLEKLKEELKNNLSTRFV
jgi:lipoyl(octanoyl) transferase|tara:strand:- start:4414 stop:4962 length:549 start_codon:yes stop_codon:yes gene_type:complete